MTQDLFEPRHQDMGRHILSGILNSGVAQVIRVLCQFGSVVILSRLLLPYDFGILAMVSPAYGFVLMFQDLGLGQATIQKKVLNHDEVNAFFWVNAAAGAALTLVTMAISPLLAMYYHEPRVGPLTAAIGLLVFVGALGNQPGAILQRRMEFRLSSWISIVGALAGLATSIIFALIIKNYWALYWGMVVSTVLPVIGTWIASGWRPTAPKRAEGMGEMLKFGAGVTSANISNFFSGNMDNILIGWKWGEQLLGFYDRAYKLLLFPIQRIVGPIMSTMVPVLSRLNDDPAQYRTLTLRTLTHLTFAIWPGIVWAIIFADPLVPFLMGDKWAPAIDIFQPLALAGIIQILNYPSGCLYISQGRSKEFAWWSFAGASIDVCSFILGLSYGPRGVAIAFAISEWFRTPLIWWLVTRKGPVELKGVVQALLPSAFAVGLAAGALLLFKVYAPENRFTVLFLSGILAYAVAAIAMTVSPAGRETLQHLLGIGLKVFNKIARKST